MHPFIFDKTPHCENAIFFDRKIEKNKFSPNRMLINDTTDIIALEMKILNKSDKTIDTYMYTMSIFQQVNHLHYIDQIDRQSVLKYIASNYRSGKRISNKTKANRSKCIKSVLNKLFKKGYITATSQGLDKKLHKNIAS